MAVPISPPTCPEVGGLIGLSGLSINGLQKAGQAPVTANTEAHEGNNYVYLGDITTINNSYRTEVLLVIGLHRPTWADDAPSVQIIKSNTDNPGNPKVSAFNLFGTVTNNIFRDGNKIYLKNNHTYGTSYSVIRLCNSALINLVMKGSTAPSGTDLETIL